MDHSGLGAQGIVSLAAPKQIGRRPAGRSRRCPRKAEREWREAVATASFDRAQRLGVARNGAPQQGRAVVRAAGERADSCGVPFQASGGPVDSGFIDVLRAVANGLDRRKRQETGDRPGNTFRGVEQTLHQCAFAEV
jgi:hypothetical protein